MRFVFLSVWVACPAWGAAPDSASAPHIEAQPALERMQVFEDVSGRMGFEDVLALPSGRKGGFVPLSAAGVKAGFSKSAWWVRAIVSNRGTADQSFVLAIPEPRVAYVTFYLARAGRWVADPAASTPDPTSLHPLSREPLMQFTLHAGEQVGIMIRARSDTALALAPKLYATQDYDARERRSALWGGVLIGGLLALAWCALLIACFARSAAFFALAGLCFTTSLYEAALRGYTRLYLWTHAVEWNARSVPVFGCISALLFIVFLLRIADGEKTRIPARRVLIALAVLQGVAVAGSALGSLYVFDQLAVYVSLAQGIVQVSLAAWLARRNTPTARIMLATVGFALLNFLLHAGEASGWFSGGPAWLNSDVQPNPVIAITGLATHLVVLAAWINHVGRGRLQAQAALLEWQRSEQERLRHQVAERTVALNDALRDAREQNQQKVETLGYVSHDLRAPLATIASYARLLRERADSRQTSLLMAIERSVTYQQALIDELVGYAKAELRPLDIAPTATDLPALLADIAEYSVALCAQLNNQFYYQALTALPRHVSIDGRRLQQVLLNLLSNASKFTRDGVVMMTVRARWKDGQWQLGFNVADTGIGMQIEPGVTLFSALRQMQSVNGATGLGLFISQRIVETMGGQLRVDTAPQRGTAFSFEVSVPAVDAGVAGRAATVPYSDASASSPQRHVRRTRGHEHEAPPEHARRELAALARLGRMTDIERWLDAMADAEPGCAAYLAELRRCLEAFDFPAIEALARMASPASESTA
jgi:signal transduction histidine kinase